MKGEDVLIHCKTGISLSPTVVIAYIMKKYEISTKDALGLVYNARYCISPNSQFCYQLRIWEEMSYKIGANHRIFRCVLFASLKAKVIEDFSKNDSKLGISNYLRRFESYLSKLSLFERNDGPLDKGRAYCCLKCNNLLFNEINVFTNDVNSKCKSIYIELINWLNDYLANNSKSLSDLKSGKIVCLKCCQQLGSFNWHSRKGCNCPSHQDFGYYSVIEIDSNKVKIN
jgi:hypothetical protein